MEDLTIWMFCVILTYMPQTISTTYARDNFADVFNRTAYAGEEFIVRKSNGVAIKVTPLKQEVGNKKKMTMLDFAFELAKIHAKGLPSDLAKNHDKYAWE